MALKARAVAPYIIHARTDGQVTGVWLAHKAPDYLNGGALRFTDHTGKTVTIKGEYAITRVVLFPGSHSRI